MIRLAPILIALLVWQTSAHAASKYEESLKELAEGVIAEAVKLKQARLAVLDFADGKGEVTPVGQFLAEELATQVLVVGELAVVDRKLLVATMKKHRLSHLETAQTKAARRVAKALRIDAFISGSFVEIPEGIQVTAKVVSPKSVQAVGAARATLPKAGPLTAFFKPPVQPKVETVIPKEPEPPPLSVPAHTNEYYSMSVTGVQRQDQRIALDLILENLSPQDMNIHCQLQGTFLQDERGSEWRQNVTESRDGLCVKGMELGPRKKGRVLLIFPVNDKDPGRILNLHFHETSPRHDAVFAIGNLKLDPQPAPQPSESTDAPPVTGH